MELPTAKDSLIIIYSAVFSSRIKVGADTRQPKDVTDPPENIIDGGAMI
ncbi:MAG: hypothetical protein JRE27_12395, partial [Deltaproteobacteria bacterium]|nr:hypothetical protein [Deltaproteobacteria bacterium]